MRLCLAGVLKATEAWASLQSHRARRVGGLWVGWCIVVWALMTGTELNGFSDYDRLACAVLRKHFQHEDVELVARKPPTPVFAAGVFHSLIEWQRYICVVICFNR